MAVIHDCKGLFGFCCTQLTDTFLEKNGLLTPERQPKLEPLAIAQATRGARIAAFIDRVRNPLGYDKRWLKRLRLLEAEAGVAPPLSQAEQVAVDAQPPQSVTP